MTMSGNDKSAEIIERESRLADYQGSDRIITSHEYAQRLKEQAKPIFRVMTKIPGLDRWIEGCEGGELIIISGIPKSGKSLLAQTLTVNFLEQGVHSVWFTYELTPRQFLERFPGQELPMFFLPREHKPNVIAWVRDRIWEAKLKYDARIVFIDHLHYIVDIERRGNLSLEIGTVVRQLKQVAIDLNMGIFLLCHMKGLEEKQRPSARAIRDSAFITAESDVTIIIHRLKRTENQAGLLVEYSRRTGALSQRLKLQKIDGLLKEVTENAGDEEETPRTGTFGY